MMDTATPPNAIDLTAQATRRTEMMKRQLLKTFAHVPDDKLQWSPTPTCRTSLEIVAHCAYVNGVITDVLFSGEKTAQTLSEGREKSRQLEESVTDREQAVRLLEEATANVLSAIAAVTPERAAGNVETPFGPLPMSFWLMLSATHMSNHAAQIDYLQTAWGDTNDHF